MCGEKGHKFFKCPMRELVDKLRKEVQVPKALNHTRSQDSGEEVRLEPQTRKVSCLLDIGSDLPIASTELKDFRQDIEEDQVCFSIVRSYGTSKESGTLSIKFGSVPWEEVVAYFARLPAGIDVLLGLDGGLNKVDVAKKEARIKAQTLSSKFKQINLRS